MSIDIFDNIWLEPQKIIIFIVKHFIVFLTNILHLQICGIFWKVAWKPSKLLVGTVHKCSLTAAFLRTDEVHKTLPTESTPVVLWTWKIETFVGKDTHCKILIRVISQNTIEKNTSIYSGTLQEWILVIFSALCSETIKKRHFYVNLQGGELSFFPKRQSWKKNCDINNYLLAKDTVEWR